MSKAAATKVAASHRDKSETQRDGKRTDVCAGVQQNFLVLSWEGGGGNVA